MIKWNHQRTRLFHVLAVQTRIIIQRLFFPHEPFTDAVYW